MKKLSVILLLLFTSAAFSQSPAINVKYITENLKIDGVLDEPIWQQADKADDFWQFFPRDSVKSNNHTTVKLLYNDKMLYVGITAQTVSNKFVISSLRRDFIGTTSDNVSVVFDPFNDGTNAFQFSVNPYGVQRETLISGGGATRENFNPNWDVKWQSESKMYDSSYVIEMAIPFTSLKFKEGGQKWRFQTYRWDLQTNEQSVWSRVPQNQLLANLAFLGEIVFEKPLGKSKPPVYIIPYINAITSKDYTANKASKNLSFGGDAKVAIGNGMNLDITVNPDFSNVEVDNIVTNLTRFEISLPEKRQFFIDNNDLFGSYGSSLDAIPFFSRRIGLVTDTLGRTIENNILGGVRLSGKLDQNWRLGFLNIQTDDDPASKIVSNNNTMFSLQRKVSKRSNISAFMINRQTFKNYDFQKPSDKYNRVMGIDFNLASSDSKWTGKYYIHKSFQPNDNSGNISTQATVTYNTRRYLYIMDWVYVDKDFRSDLGFIPRVGVFKSGNGLGRNWYPSKGKINRHSVRLINVMFWKPALNFKKTDHDLWLTHDIEFKSQAILGFRYMYQNVFLTNAFDPTRTPNGTKLPANSTYNYAHFTTTFTTNNSKKIAGIASASIGQFFNGYKYSLSATANLRIQPKVAITLLANYDRIVLPKPYPIADILLISPKLDLTFSKSLFWSTLVQFSNQRKNLGINSRLQWRFAPLSDLFLVYNDNYYTGDFAPTFRSINLKFSYWFNL